MNPTVPLENLEDSGGGAPADRDWWTRSAKVVDVSFPERTVDLVVLPYDDPITVPWQGRKVQETIARGAFDGIARRANRVRVNRDHDLARTVGRAVAFHPNRTEGLVAEVRIAQTPLGDETLTLLADGDLDASAGFLPMDGGMKWTARNAYTITRGWLRHIALTPEPAYENAGVLAIRSAQLAGVSVTPRRDQWIREERERRLARVVASDHVLQ